MNINPIFSSFLATEELTSINNAQLIEYTNEIKQLSDGVVKSNVNGWQSDRLSIPHPEIAKLTEEIIARVRTVADQIGIKKSTELFLSNLWINANPIAGFNRPHIHPDDLFAGVYYVSVPENSGSIIFKNPAINLQYHVRESLVENINQFIAPNWVLKPKPGMLLLFPGWLEHYVEPNTSTEDRISIAFNIYGQATDDK
jgi:uncharacterized protein (TIGR02466 family)